MSNGFILETIKDNCCNKHFKDCDAFQISDLQHIEHLVCVSKSLCIKEKDTKFDKS